MANDNQKKNNLPVVIIGVVLIVSAAVGLFWYNSAKPGTTGSNRQANNTQAKPTPVIAANAAPGAVPPNSTGSPTASVTVEEFADFQCPTCATVHPMLSEVRSMYGNRIRFVFRNNPLAIPAHDKAYDAAVAAEAAGLQGKFWEMQNMLFQNQQAWSANPGYKQIWADYAQKLGLDVAKFQNDVAGLGAKQRVDEDLKRGRSLGVTGTPSIFINGVPVDTQDFNVSGLKMLIDRELAKTAAPAAPPANGANTAK